MRAYASIFRDRGRRVSFVELLAPQEVRLVRNRTPLRLDRKPSKRNLDWSDSHLREMDEKYDMTSPPEYRERSDWLTVDTTNLTAAETAAHIVRELGLTTLP